MIDMPYLLSEKRMVETVMKLGNFNEQLPLFNAGGIWDNTSIDWI